MSLFVPFHATNEVRIIERMTDLIDTKSRWTAGNVFKGSFGGAAVGAVVNVVLFLLGGAMTSLSARFDPSAAAPGDLKLVAVVMASMVPALPAGLAALVVGRFAKNPATVFMVLAVVFGLFSMGGPANLAGAGAGLKVVLALMHVVSAAALAGGIVRSTR